MTQRIDTRTRLHAFARSNSFCASTDTSLRDARELFKTIVEAHGAEFRHHPLGFWFYKELIETDITLRAHFWPNDWKVPAGQTAGEIHDHKFELRSVIVDGVVENENFDVTASVAGAYRIHNVIYDHDVTSLIATAGRFDLRSTSFLRVCKGEAYFVEAKTVHRARAPKTPAATLVFADESSLAPAPRVLVPIKSKPPSAFDRALLVPSEIDELVAFAASLT
jgi:hypothetical protein